MKYPKCQEISKWDGLEDFAVFHNYKDAILEAYQEIQWTHDTQLNFYNMKGPSSLSLGTIN